MKVLKYYILREMERKHPPRTEGSGFDIKHYPGYTEKYIESAMSVRIGGIDYHAVETSGELSQAWLLKDDPDYRDVIHRVMLHGILGEVRKHIEQALASGPF